jgi:hypothetical protein
VCDLECSLGAAKVYLLRSITGLPKEARNVNVHINDGVPISATQCRYVPACRPDFLILTLALTLGITRMLGFVSIRSPRSREIDYALEFGVTIPLPFQHVATVAKDNDDRINGGRTRGAAESLRTD